MARRATLREQLPNWDKWDDYYWSQTKKKKKPRKIIVIPLNWPTNNELLKIKEVSKKKLKKKKQKYIGYPPTKYPYGSKPPKETPKSQFPDWDTYYGTGK